ncbi:MFS transporter [Actinoplanes cyaneus]|uniref:MFS transporter n=1 Tax=Actinoplanes cyaneus TaxID=52696 RepID=A0A919M4A9_9ACTN|nr:MFS transporter [Actinoplanes cyaneus]MCW2140093.1 putative arabinose efflux permease, MFS family [Actinoplanes cyaneus]GID65407.1 MFS transporter [Actinoplanes cyaneus]
MTRSTTVTRGRSLTGLLTLTGAAFLSVTYEMLPTGLLPAISDSLDVPVSRAGLLVTAYALMVALLAAPLGAWTARFARRPLLVAALCGYAVSAAISALAGDFAVALAARIAGGVMHGLFWAIAVGYAVRLVPPGSTGRAATFVFGGGTIAFVAGVPAGTSLGELVGWRPAFGLLAGLFALLAVAVRWLLPALPGTPAGVSAGLARVVRAPGATTVVAATVVLCLGFYGFYTYVATFLRDAGVPEGAIGPSLLVYGVTNGAGIFLGGVLADRRPRASMLIATGGLIAALALAAVASGAVPAVLALAACGLAFGTMPVFLQAAALRVAPEAPDAASGLTTSAFNMGIGGGALFGATVLDHAGVSAVPAAGAALAACGLAVVLLGSRAAFPAAQTSSRTG